MNIYITGSMAYDRIMTFPGKFSDHILPDKIHALNVSFQINRLEEKFGGCAGNIAYTLALLGEKPIIVANAGCDFARYKEKLDSLELSREGIGVLEQEFCAGAYIITDETNSQITGFNPGAMRLPSSYAFPRLAEGDIGIVAPTNTEDMQAHPRLLKAKKARCIFDPGQQIPVLSGEAMLEAVSGSFILISNDYELEMICKSTGKTQAELRGLTQNLITTLGEKGSLVHCGEKEEYIPAVPIAQALDPTGAGDAYRSGLLKGLARGLDVVEAARMGATAASFCVERYGTQELSFTQDEFEARYRACFS